MPAQPSVLRSIEAIRKAIAAGNKVGSTRASQDPSLAVSKLFRLADKIVADRETLNAVLAFAPEIEAFRGKGSQATASEFSQNIGWLVYNAKNRLPPSNITPDLFQQEEELVTFAENSDVIACFEALATHAFSRTQGPAVHSRHAAGLRTSAWKQLTCLTNILRRPEHLAHAIKVAANPRASIEERTAAVEFLPKYWGGDDPDDATTNVLQELAQGPPARSVLVAVMHARLELGLESTLGALCAVEDWDDEDAW